MKEVRESVGGIWGLGEAADEGVVVVGGGAGGVAEDEGGVGEERETEGAVVEEFGAVEGEEAGGGEVGVELFDVGEGVAVLEEGVDEGGHASGSAMRWELKVTLAGAEA